MISCFSQDNALDPTTFQSKVRHVSLHVKAFLWKYDRRLVSDLRWKCFPAFRCLDKPDLKGRFEILPDPFIAHPVSNVKRTQTALERRCIPIVYVQVEYFQRSPLANKYKEVTPAAQYSLQNRRPPIIYIS